MVDPRDLLRLAGDLPAGVKDLLRQRALAREEEFDRDLVEAALMDWSLNPKEGSDE